MFLMKILKAISALLGFVIPLSMIPLKSQSQNGTVNFTTDRTQACTPAAIQFTDQSQAPAGQLISSWHWYFGDGQEATVAAPSHVYNLAGTYSVKLVVTSSNGWKDSLVRTNLIQAVSPKANLGPDTALCFGSSLTLAAGYTSATASYNWSTGETSSSITILDEGTYWVELSDGGCSSRDTIVVRPQLPVTAAFDATITGKCLPVTVVFKDASVARCGQQIIRWRWDFGDGTLSDQPSPAHLYTVADTFAVRLTVTTNEGFTISRSKQIIIENTVPVVNAGPDLVICKGSGVQLDAGTDSAVFLWSPAAGLDRTDIRRPFAKPDSSMLYIVEVSKCATTVRDSVWVKVESIGKPVVRRDDDKLVASKNSSYQWFYNGVPISGANRREYEPRKTGQYTVLVRNAGGCESMSDPYYFLPGKKGKWLHGIRIKCSPNPGHGLVWLLLDRMPEGPIRLTVLDRAGNVVYRSQVVNHSTMMDLSKLAKGQYFIELVAGDEKVTVPVIIH